MKKYLILIIIVFLFILAGCNSNENPPVDEEDEIIDVEEEDKEDEKENEKEDEDEKEKEDEEEDMENPIIKIILTDEREIVIELYREIAPITVANFIKLVDEKYFDGVIFHRVIENFMIQSGGYYLDSNTIREKPNRPTIKGEFSANKIPNDLKHELGVISMARSSLKNSASTQFFICSATSPHLDGNYAAFGKAIDEASINVILELHKVPTVFVSNAFANFPAVPITIKTIIRAN